MQEIDLNKYNIKKIKNRTTLNNEKLIIFEFERKKIKLNMDENRGPGCSSSSTQSKINAAAPMYFFLSIVTNVPATTTEPLSLSFADLLDPSLGIMKESLQINFMVEPGWLLAQYCAHKIQ